MKHPLLQVELANERDIVTARQRARQVSALLGFDLHDQARIATAVSELARNAVRYAGSGAIEFSLDTQRGPGPYLQVVISDSGPGIADLGQATQSAASSGESRLGLISAQRMMDSFRIDSAPGHGTRITLGKAIARRAESFRAEHIAAITRELALRRTHDPEAEVQQQNRELLRSLEELRLRQEELTRLNAELEDTNRGVVALYAELDERATHLRLADEAKTRFLSSISHEFRTPVNSILALSRILLQRVDGELSLEQEKQVRYICQAAEQLSTLIDDLLDLRKVESGRIQLRLESFSVADLFGALRGMFKPLAANDRVALIFEAPAQLPQLHTDQGKVAQILRNLISNALKFTERGWVRVSARLEPGPADSTSPAAGTGPKSIVFVVADTGLGIAPEHHREIFEEFTQVENPLQSAVKGTGLGLSVSRRLAGLLGGSIELSSTPGKGSVFSLTIPLRLDAEARSDAQLAAGAKPAHDTQRILIIDDSEMERYALRQILSSGHYEIIEASGGYDGLRLARHMRPDLIFLDLAMPDVHGAEVLKLLKAVDATRPIPVVIFTSQSLDEIGRYGTASAEALLMKSELSSESVADVIRRAHAASEVDHAAGT